MLMNVPVGYDDDLEFRNTHPDVLPRDDNLGAVKAKKPNAPSRSVLGDIKNVSQSGILTKGVSSRNTVKWSDIAQRGLRSGG